MKKVLVVDWLDKYGGAERVISALVNTFSFDKTYSIINIMKEDDLKKIYSNKPLIIESPLKIFGGKFRMFFFFFHYFISKLKIDKDTDIIISSSHAIAKGVKKSSNNQIHICYFQARNFKYIWDDYKLYFGSSAFILNPIINILRKTDKNQALTPDYIIANSKYVQNWIKETYNRTSVVIYPPVDLIKFPLQPIKKNYYIAVGRIVAYKRFDIVVEAFNKLNYELIIIGDGAELNNIKKIANNNISFLGYKNSEEVNTYISQAKGFIHSGIEDFGIAPIEAQACGTPVIAYGKGGILETVIDSETGVFFKEQTVDSLIDAVFRFEKIKFDIENVRSNALKFSQERFVNEFKSFVEEKTKKIKN